MIAKVRWAALLASLVLTMHGAASAGPVPDTGQTVFYNNTEEMQQAPLPGEDFYGQDATYLINPPSYTKLDAAGGALPDDAATWSMVRDNVAGLIWEVKTDDGSIHDKDNPYTWYDSNPATNGGNAGQPGDGTDTEDFINALNAQNFGGFSDWRIPTVKELMFVNAGISSGYFGQTTSNLWSSTSVIWNNGQAWWVDYDDYPLQEGNKSDSRYVRAVRGGSLASVSPRLIDNGDGTVTDIDHGLMWVQEPSATGFNWMQALSFSEGLATGGYDDWRLPNLNELLSIVDFSRVSPAFDTSLFLNINDKYLWSSTTTTWMPGASGIYTMYGFSYRKTKTESGWYALSVRGGQAATDGALLISSPRQSAVWGIGKSYSIVWDTKDLGGSVKISLSRAGGKAETFETVSETTENDGAFDWTVTDAESDNCVLRVEPVGDPARASQAGLFRILSVKPETIAAPCLVAVMGGASATFPLKVSALEGTYDLSAEITSWTSSDETVATVGSGGSVAAVSPGYATITATYNGAPIATRIEVIAPEQGESEPNGSAAEATLLEEGLWARASIADGNDVDYFSIAVPERSIIRFEIISNGANLVLPVEIVDAGNNTLASFTVPAVGRSRMTVTLPEGATTVKVASKSAGEYVILYTFLANANGGQKIWEAAPGWGGYSTPAVIGDRVYVGSDSGRLTCYDARTGARIWEHNTGNVIYSSPVVYDGRVYVATDYSLFAIDARNGGRLWSASFPSNGHMNRSSPAVYDGKVYIASRYDDNGEPRGMVTCVDAVTGEKLWEYVAGGYIYASPTVADGKVFIGGEYRVGTISYGKLYTLDAATGDRLREYLTGSTIYSSAAYGDGIVYIGSNDGKIYAIDAESNQLVWSFQTGSSIGYRAPAIDGENLYAANNNSLVCIDRGTGVERWRQYLSGGDSSPAVSAGKVYAGGYGSLYAFDAHYGDFISSASIGYDTCYNPVVSGGRVYVRSSDGKLYCIDAGDPLADGWQMFMHDVGHSGDFRKTHEGLHGVILSSSVNRMLVGGQSATGQLTLYASYLDGSHDVTADATGWTSSAPGVATVSATGLATAVSPGEAVITASYGGFEASLGIVVEALPATAETEPNDASDGAGLLSGGAYSYGVLSGVFDVDFYRIEVSDTKTVRVEVLVNGPAPPARMRVTDAWGNQFSETVLSGGTSSTAVVELFSGTNYVVIDTTSLAPGGEYLVRYSVLTNPEAGEKLWEYSSGSGIQATPTVMGDSIFIATTGGELQCVNRTTGSKAWGYNLGSGCTSSPMVYRGMAFQASQAGKLVAIDVSTGRKAWEFAAGGFDWSTPAISGEELFIGSADHKLYCLDIATGALRWSYETQGSVYSSPAVADGRVYVGSDDGKVHCVDWATGAMLWTYRTNGAVRSSPALVDGILYIGSNDAEVYSLDAATGVKLWSFRTNGEIGYASPAAADGRIYIGSGDWMVYCLDADTGIKLWESAIGVSYVSLSNGKVYAGSSDARIYGLDVVSGARIWQYAADGAVYASPVLADGKAYAVSGGGKLYCIDAGDPLADGWQMHRHDLEHRGDASIVKEGFSGITLSKTSDHLTFGGTNCQMQLQAYGNYVDGSFAMTEAITGWSSSDETVAVVGASGLVTAVGPGATTITAVYGGYTNTIAVVVEAVQENREVEPNETAAAATALTESEVFYGSLDGSADVDVFAVNLPEGQKIRLEVLFNQYIQNTEIVVSDAEGTELLRFNPSSLAWESRIVSMPAGANTITLTSLSGGSGEYLMRYTFLANASGGQKIWEFSAAGGIYSSPAISAGKVYFTTLNGTVYCVDEDSGKKIWEFHGGCSSRGSPLISGSRLYVAFDTRISCLDADRGNKLWEYDVNYGAREIALHEDKLYVSVNNTLLCLDAHTGRKNWEQPIGDDSYSAPTVYDGWVYVGTRFYFNSREQGKLYAFDATSGEKKWERVVDGSLYESSPAVADGKIYIGSSHPSNKLHCHDAKTGERLWEFSGGEPMRSPVFFNGRIYVQKISWFGQCYALDAQTGSLAWQYWMGEDSYSYGAPAISEGKVYLSSRFEESGYSYGKVHCVDAETGTPLWSARTDGVVDYSSPAIENGKVFVGASNGALYCLDAGDPDAGGWTMFQNDLQRTGDAAHTHVGVPESYFVSIKPVEPMKGYKFYLVGQYLDGNRTIPALWASDDPSVGVMDGNTLSAVRNGRVTVSAVHEGVTYARTLYLQPDFEGFESLYNDSVEKATPLDDGAFIQGEILLGDADYYSIHLAEASLVEIAYMSYSETADVRMDILDAEGRIMASALSQDGREMVVSVGLPAGDHAIRLTGSGDIDQNAFYAVTRKIVGGLALGGLASVNLGGSVESSIDNLLDRREFTFSLSEKKAVKVGFSPTSETAMYRIELLDVSETVIDQIDASFGVPVYFEAVYNAGNYIVRVTPLTVVDAASPFTVSLDESGRMVEEEPNDDYAAATELTVGSPMTGRLSHGADTDIYAFTLNAPGYLDLAFTCPGSYNRFKISVYKESGENLINGMDVPVNKDVTLPMGLSMGRYYIRVAGYDAQDVDILHYYTLSLLPSAHANLEIESNNTLKFANAIEKNIVRKGRIFSSMDMDYYGFYLPAAGYFTISFTPESATGDYKVSLVNENDEVAYQKISTNGAPVLISVSPLPGNYFVRVEAGGDLDQYSFYDLTLGTDVSDFQILGLKSLVSVNISAVKSALSVSETLSLSAVAGYSDATTEAIANPIWTSLDPTIATVNAAGQLTAAAEGATTIVATHGGITGQFQVVVGAAVGVYDQHHGNLILVAGGGVATTNTLKDATQYLSDLVYRRFKGRLFSDMDIRYINPMTWHDVDGDGYDDNIVDDANPTVAGFESAVTGWAASQSTDGPLYIYLIDHGGIDKFDMYPNQLLTATRLKETLNAFQAATGRKVVVVIEACKSGSFTDDLTEGAAYDRVVVTSTDNLNAYLDLDGRISFTQFFLDSLHAGNSVQSAFLKADSRLDKMGLPYSAMVPQLAESGGALAGNVYLGGNFAIAGLEPEIVETSPDQVVTANQPHGFYAALSDLEDIQRVWAVVVPPGYVPPEVSPDLETPVLTLPTFDLVDPDGDARYEGSYGDFSFNGVYTITFYAINSNGNVSVSSSISVTVEGGTSLDTDGDGMPDDWEDQYPGLDKNMADGGNDADQDGLTNYREYQAGANPISTDSDSDGMNDAWEVGWGLNPTVPDGLADADGDGVSNLLEYQDETNPIDAGSLKDHVPPVVLEVAPITGEVHVSPDVSVSIVFDEAMDNAKISIGTISIVGETSGPRQGTLSYDAINHAATITPDSPFAYGETVTVTVSGALTDAQGNMLDGNRDGVSFGSPSDDFRWQFAIAEDPGLRPPNLYDANGDWLIGDFELLDAIDAWAGGSMASRIGAACDVDFYLLDLIDLWKNGFYDYTDQAVDPCFPWGKAQ